MSNLTSFTLTRLSQGQLNLLETCPRKFQYIYLDRLGAPTSLEQQERMAWGHQFHLLMQQRELGLPIAPLLEKDPQVCHAVQALVQATPDLLPASLEGWREAEHCRTLAVQEYLLTAIYDLIVAEEGKAKILDWKTYPRPKNRTQLARNWQTRLYLYILAETSAYKPEQISMTYWFVKLPDRPQSLTFRYNSQQHAQTQHDLSRLLGELRERTEQYRRDGLAFPQVPEATGECRHCHFASSCGRSPHDETPIASQDWPAAIAEIEEFSLTDFS